MLSACGEQERGGVLNYKPRRAKRLNLHVADREPDEATGRALISNEPWYAGVQSKIVNRVKACKLKVAAKNELAPASAASYETGGSITSA